MEPAGLRVTPCVISQGLWFPKDIPYWHLESTSSGWSNAKIFEKWFNLVFIPDVMAVPKPLYQMAKYWSIIAIVAIIGHTSCSFKHSSVRVDQAVTSETMPQDPSLWHILVLDRHKTHITADFMINAWEHKVWPSWLPSH